MPKRPRGLISSLMPPSTSYSVVERQTARLRCRDKGGNLPNILLTIRFDPTAHIHPPGTGDLNGLHDVLRCKTARQHHGITLRHRPRQPPVKGSTGSTVRAGLKALEDEPGDNARIASDFLNDIRSPDLQALNHRAAKLPAQLRRLIAAELDVIQTAGISDSPNPGRLLIDKDTHRAHGRGKLPNDCRCKLRRHLAPRRGKDEADQIRPRVDGATGARDVPNAANLDLHG